MFFIVKGDCSVNFKDSRGRIRQAERLLTEGDHFGEISIIYKCLRTASVVSRNYSIIARLSYLRLREVLNEFPTY